MNSVWWIFFLPFFISCASIQIPHQAIDTFKNPADSLYFTRNTDSLRITNTNDFLRRNPHGNWEMYVAGNPYQLGDRAGFLTADLFNHQRIVFMEKLEQIVPSPRRRKMIMKFLNWYGRNLDEYIDEKYLVEIFALSNYLDSTYIDHTSNYKMTLMMHAAHDLGHALRDLAIVGCTSVASWGEKTVDGKLLIGRNFDFYVGEDFAENKVVNFIKPQGGIPFMSISWPGMIGVVSGMNLEGLTVTMNAGKSSIPLSAKSPVSIVAREILEKASNIEEAIKIAQEAKPFVSESLMIGSAKDKKAVLLEISPKNFGVFEVENQHQLLCTNHFQSKAYQKDKRNAQHIIDSHSQYRYDRLQELLSQESTLSPNSLAKILRNQQGQQNENIGLGNDKSLNHLLAHHAIIFKPEDKIVWVSNSPYQMGKFTAYDLNTIFSEEWQPEKELFVDSLTIEADPFIDSKSFKDYKEYLRMSDKLEQAIKNKEFISADEIEKYKLLNPNLWLVYYLSGKYWYSQEEYELASKEFEEALKKVIPTKQAEQEIKKLLQKSIKKWKK